MKRKTFYLGLTVGSLALLSLAVAGFFWITANSPLALLTGGVNRTPQGTIFVSKQSPAMVSILVNPQQLVNFRRVVTPPSQRGRSRAELQQGIESLLANGGIDYDRDIKPWLGDELTLAMTSLDVDRQIQNGAQRGYLLVASSKNGTKSREFLNLFWQKRATTSTDIATESYKGVKLIYENSTAPGQPLALATAAVGGDFVLFANSPKVLKEAINNVQVASLSLGENPDYQQALDQLKQPRLGLAFVNLPALGAFLGNKTIVEAAPLFKSLSLALSVAPEGLLADTSLFRVENLANEPSGTKLKAPVKALQYLPVNSAIALGGSNLEQFWQRLTGELENDPNLLALIQQPFTQLESQLGIDLNQDIFSWVQGEYALGFLPSETVQDWIFVAEKPKNGEAIDKLDAIAKQQGLSLSSFNLGDQTVTAWTKLTTNQGKAGKQRLAIEAKVQGVRAEVGDYEIFTTTLEAMERALASVNNSILDNPDFKQSISALPQPNGGYFYTNWSQSQSWIESKVPFLPVLELVAQPLFSQLNTIAVTAAGSDAASQRAQIFLELGQKE